MSREIRRQLYELCRSSRTRTVGEFPELPSDWSPGTVRVPGTQDMFTPAGAWEFIALCLKDETIELYEMVLDVPAGKRAWYMTVNGHDDKEIYIKIHFGKSKVIARSFHPRKRK